MRKKFSRSLKSLFAIFLCFSLIFTFLVGDSAFAAIQDFSSTSIYHDEERIIAPGVTLNIWKGVKNANTYKSGTYYHSIRLLRTPKCWPLLGTVSKAG